MTSPVLPGARIYAEDTNAVGDASARRVVARLVASGTQSIPHNTATAITYAAEDYDSHNGHDIVTNNSRWTVPAGYDGYYDIRVTGFMGSRTDYSLLDSWVRKNGTTNVAPSGRRGAMSGAQSATGLVAAAAQAQAIPTACRVFLAAGEYVEHMIQHANTAAVAVATNQSGQFTSIMEIALDRF